MTLTPWYRVVTLREEVREGRSFSPDEFAIAFEQVVAGTAPADYTDPAQFFLRTYFTRALTEHAGWSTLKRGYYGTYHRMSLKHLDRYVAEFPAGRTSGHSTRSTRWPASGAGLAGKRLRYRELTA